MRIEVSPSGFFSGLDVRETTRWGQRVPPGASFAGRRQLRLYLRNLRLVWISSQGTLAAKRRKNRRAIAASKAPIGARTLLPQSANFTAP